MNWLILIVAGLFEVVWAVALKMSNGFKNITADAVFVGGMAASVWLLAVAMKSIPMGTAYAVWTGVGAVGGFVAGIVLFGESASALSHPNSNAHALCQEVTKGVKVAGNEVVFDLGRRI